VATEAVYTDGRSATRHDVRVAIEPPYLTIRGDELETVRWPLEEVELEGGQGKVTRVLRPTSGEQLTITGADRFTERLRREVGVSWDQRLMNWSFSSYTFFLVLLAAVGLFAAVILSLGQLSDTVAHWVPRNWMDPIGQTAHRQLTEAEAVCGRSDSAGSRQLRRLTSELNPTNDRIRVMVYDRELPNALTVPGGRIIVFDGLFSEVERSEEFVGVLAHEVAHVVHRDPTESLIRTLGTRFFWALTLGDAAQLANTLVNSSYSRKQERRADRTALRLLHRAGWSSTGLEQFFRRLSDRRGDHQWIISFLSTHPTPSRRVDYLSENSRELNSPLTETQWEAIRRLCGTKSSAAEARK
jgi:Zn-dependent protease with chaperone function